MFKLFTIIVLAGSAAALFDPYVQGPYEVLFKHYKFGDTQLEKHLDVFAPSGNGTYPFIFYSNSLASNLQPETSVITVLKHIASWGFVIVGPWKVSLNPADNYKIEYFLPVIKFSEDNLVNDFLALGAPQGFSIDFSKSLLVGHSAGNHQNVNFLKETCGNFIAEILLSPVDGADPFGLIDEFTITPGQKLNFVLPTLTVQAGLDPKRGAILYPACAPENLANMRFYNAMSGDRWFVNATLYGHTDFFEPGFAGAVDFFNLCASDSDTDKLVYRDFVAGTVVAYAKAMTDPVNHCDMLAYVEDPQIMSVEANIINEVRGGQGSRCNPGCVWSPPEESTPK
jgi:hypothetical protein